MNTPHMHYKPARKFSLSIALTDFYAMLEAGHFHAASTVYRWIMHEQAMRAEVGTFGKSNRYIDRALTMDELIEARDAAQRRRFRELDREETLPC